MALHKRILKIEFNGSPIVTLIVNYAPVEGTEGAEEHFEILSDVIKDIPKHNIIL